MKLSWLKAVGKAVVKGAKLTGQVAGVIESNAPAIKFIMPDSVDRVVDQITQGLGPIKQAVVDVEVLGQIWGWTGEQKLEEASKRVASIIIHSLMASGRPVDKPELLKDAAVRLTQAVVDILNSFDVDDEVTPAA